MNSTALDDYLEAVRNLWPAGTEPHPVEGGDSQSPPSTEFRVIPSEKSPRLLVPARNRRAASRAMLRFSTSLSIGDVAKRVVMAGILRTGWIPLKHRVNVPNSSESLTTYLSDVVFKQHVDVSLGLGTARANRKPVLQVFDAHGQPLAFVKVGVDDASRYDVQLEEQSLARLRQASIPDFLEVPSILQAGEWRGNRVLVLSTLKGRATLRPTQRAEIPARAMEALHVAFGSEVMPLTATPKWRQLSSDASLIEDGSARARFKDAIDRLSSSGGEENVSVGAWHGDWTPWNMSRARRRVQLWDWERFETGVPWGLDVCHFSVQTACRKNGMTPDTVLEGLRVAEAALHSRPGPSAASGGVYLATITARYLTRAERLHGEKIAAQSQTMLLALEQWLTVSQSRA